MTPSLQTLFLPLEDGAVPSVGPALFVGAAWHPFLSGLKADVWQPFKPLADTLIARDFSLLPAIPEKSTYTLALVDVPKQVDEAKHWIACALRALKPDGWLVMAAPNDANGNRLEKWMKEAGLDFQSLTKNKARAVWLKRPAELPDLVKEWGRNGEKQILDLGDGIEFVSQPGLFGWDKIDTGSDILAEHLSETLKGAGADFGCGYGYLSYRVLELCENVTDFYLADADSRALECARLTLESVRGGRAVSYEWLDLSKPTDLPTLDFIVMNPPFHTGKKTESTLGQSFITTAAHHLKKGGTLWMVANAHLPYEAVLQEKFASVKQVAVDDGFKIIEARK